MVGVLEMISHILIFLFGMLTGVVLIATIIFVIVAFAVLDLD